MLLAAEGVTGSLWPAEACINGSHALQAYRNTVPVPRHWSQKRKFLQGKRGIEKPPFQLPDFIEATGISEMRKAYQDKVGWLMDSGVGVLTPCWPCPRQSTGELWHTSCLRPSDPVTGSSTSIPR